ncbi:MAG: hypothetical protein GY711_29100 [bacterium]|nr:hypothetical protein [bacterium]
MTRGVAQATFLLGVLAGLLIALIAEELWPYGNDTTIEEYRAVRDFARESFVREVSDEELLELALHGMVGGLDGYSRYYDRAESERLERETRGTYKGVGIVFHGPPGEGRVLFALTDSPAQRAGVRVGDTFKTFDGRPVADIPANELRAMLRDPDGTPIDVHARGLDGAERDLVLRPDSLVDPSVRHTRILDAELGIGYVSILSFSRETADEFDQAFHFLHGRGMRALIIDLRRNFGGVLESAVQIARRFVKGGVIVSTEGRGAPISHRAEPAEADYAGMPLVVLVDGESASASEVLAGALQDHRVAVVVGSPTYGKGMVQTIRNFERFGTRAKVTSSYYYSPSGRNFETSADPARDFGILPDLSIPVSKVEKSAIQERLTIYGPPLEAIAKIEAWEVSSGFELLTNMQGDPQLDAALALFAGERPGPHRLTQAD